MEIAARERGVFQLRLRMQRCERLRPRLAFRSWVGDGTASTKWLVKKWGDVYVHETLISHIRRLLDTDFATTKVQETPKQFMSRMQKVEDHLNSEDFAAPNGGGLRSLAKEMFSRCNKVIKLQGERIPK